MSSIRDFIPLQKLGEGSYSTVYKVRRRSDQQVYALKKVKMRNLTQKQKENALNQVRILASLECPTIVAYKEAFFDEKLSLLCIVMEFACGGDLHVQISQAKKKHTKMPEPNIWKMVADVLEALAHLHSKGILHRDLKSANIFIDREQTENSEDSSLHSGCRYKLGDLNVSKVNYGGHAYTQTGTPYYASPQVWRDQPYDNKSDIYSLGCIIYEMACLQPPFEGKNMEQLFKRVQNKDPVPIPPEYSYELADVIGLCLKKNPAKRPTASQLLQHPVVRRFISKSRPDEPAHSPHAPSTGNLNQSSKTLLQTIKLPADLKSLHKNLPCSKYDAEDKEQIKSKQTGDERVKRTPSRDLILNNYKSDRSCHYTPCEQGSKKGLKNEMISLDPHKRQSDSAQLAQQVSTKKRNGVSPHINLIHNHSFADRSERVQNHSNRIPPTINANRVNQSQVFLSPRANNGSLKNLYRSPEDYANRKNESAHVRSPADDKQAQFYSDRKTGYKNPGQGCSNKGNTNLADRYEKLMRLQLNKKQISLPRTEKRNANNHSSKNYSIAENISQDLAGCLIRDGTDEGSSKTGKKNQSKRVGF